MAKLPLQRRFGWIFELAGVTIVLGLATLVTNAWMIRHGLNGLADLQWHIAWLQHFFRGLTEGDWYPRWLGGTNYGYGSPTFVFYPPLVYYLGSALKGVGLNTEQTIVGLFSLALLGSGGMIYGYQRSRLGPWAALISAVAYLSSPYLLYVVYSFGSLSTLVAMVWLPGIWWATDQSRQFPGWRLGVSLGWLLLALTHLPSLLLALVVWLPYTLLSYRRSGLRAIAATGCATLVGFGMASMFLLPATVEKAWVNIDSMAIVGGETFYDRMIRFHHLWTTALNFSSHLSWVYFYQLCGGVAIAVFVLIAYRRHPLLVANTRQWLIFVLMLALAMTHWSWFLWQLSPTLLRVQSPTRLLGFSAMGTAMLMGLGVSGLARSRGWGVRLGGGILVLLLLLGNFAYAYQWPRRFPTLHHAGRADTRYLDDIRMALSNPYQDNLKDVPEYRPLIQGSPPPRPIPGQPRTTILDGDATVSVQTWRNHYRLMQVDATTQTTLQIRTFDYPAWKLIVNHQPRPKQRLRDGTLTLTLPAGQHVVELVYAMTPALRVGLGLSGVSCGLWLALARYYWARHD